MGCILTQINKYLYGVIPLLLHGIRNGTPAKGNAVEVGTSAAHDSAEHVSTLGSMDCLFRTFMVPVETRLRPALATAGSQGVTLVRLEGKTLDEVVCANSNLVNVLALLQRQDLFITTSVLTRLLGASSVLDGQGINTMAVGPHGNLRDFAIILVVKLASSAAAKCPRQDNFLLGRVNLHLCRFRRAIGFAFRCLAVVVAFFLLLFLLRFGGLLLGGLDRSSL